MSKKCPQTDNWNHTTQETINTSVLWTIDDFSQLNQKTGERLESSTFCALNDTENKWCLSLCPNGKTQENKEFLSLFLYLKDTNRSKVLVKWKLALIDANKDISIENTSVNTFAKGEKWGYDKFVDRTELKDPKKSLLPNDRLTIYCEVIAFAEPKTISGQRIGHKRKHNCLSNDMTAVFPNLNYSDIKFVVKGHEFCAHKFFLSARSPVFAAMFEHPMKEREQNQVIIEDIDRDVFTEVLRFIYTDKVMNEGIDFNMKLFYAADKYSLTELKSICEEYIASQLTVESVCDVLILADKHSAEKLKSEAITFMKRNFTKVVKTEGWKNVIDKSDLFKHF